MKKNITINLYGQLYAIDEDAYDLLEQYIENMKRYFGKREGGEEIADDIEHRVAELFSELNNNGVEAINIEHVQDIIHRIGNPEEMDDESASETSDADTAGAQTESTSAYNGVTPPPPPYQNTQEKVKNWFSRRRFYRDPDDKLLGGVLSGLSAYFGGNDPLPWRIIFVILALFSYASLIIVYFVIWAFTPEARTPEEKLLMRGKPVTPQTINEEMMRENNIGQSATTNAAYNRKQHSFLNACLSVLIFCVKLILFLIALCGIITLVIMAIVLSYIVTCALSGYVDEGNAFFDMIYSLTIDHTVMWQLIISMVLGLVSFGIFVYGTARWLFHRKDAASASGMQAAILAVTAVVCLIVSITLCTIAVTRGEAISTERCEKLEHEGGFYMSQFDRNDIAALGWSIKEFSGCDDNYALVNSSDNWQDDDAVSAKYLYFKKKDSYKPMKVDFNRTENYPQGYYHVEAIAIAEGKGAKINVTAGDSLIYSADIPQLDNEKLGNMARMSYEEFMTTGFALPTLTREKWIEHTHDEAKKWSYLRGESFHHNGGNITTQFQAGIEAASPQNFSVFDIRIVPDSVPTALVNQTVGNTASPKAKADKKKK